jgi:hypothetical protein
MTHTPVSLSNGEVVCSGCNRPLRKVVQASPGRKRSRVIVYEPPGEEGELEDLLAQLVERYKRVWPDTLSEVGERHWRYKALHFGLHALVTAPSDVADRLMPTEVGG